LSWTVTRPRCSPRELEELLDDASEAQIFNAASDRLRVVLRDVAEPGWRED
jgi:hypothetical protein